MIEFLCPNEHKIRCPDDKAGRTAKCPKCGVSFRIPTLEELSLGASAIASTESDEAIAAAPAGSVASGSGSGKSIAAAATAATSAKDRQIEFLCPNGHHLHGPATLQGRAGECPECGSRFRIPVIDEPETAPESLAEPQLADAEFALEDEITLESHIQSGQAAVDAGEPLEFLQVLDGPGSGVAAANGRGALGAGGSMTIAHPLAALFIELWAARDESSRVEVHLESGSVLVPDAYVKSHSQADYAVLVTRDPDGASTVTIVPWNSIARIILRAIKQVPGEIVR